MIVETEDERLYAPIRWIAVASIGLTVFYFVVFYTTQETTSLGNRWGVAVIGSIMFIGGSVYCEKEGQRFASYLVGVSGLIANIVFAAMAIGLLIGPQSALFHFMNDPR